MVGQLIGQFLVFHADFNPAALYSGGGKVEGDDML